MRALFCEVPFLVLIKVHLNFYSPESARDRQFHHINIAAAAGPPAGGHTSSSSDAVVHVVCGIFSLVAAEPSAARFSHSRNLGFDAIGGGSCDAAARPAHGDKPAADPGLGEDQRLSVPPLRVGRGHRAVRL